MTKHGRVRGVVLVVALAVSGQASHNLIARLFADDATDIRLTLRRARFRRALLGQDADSV